VFCLVVKNTDDRLLEKITKRKSSMTFTESYWKVLEREQWVEHSLSDTKTEGKALHMIQQP